MWGFTAAGFVFLVVAWVTKNHHPNIRRINWDWVHSALMLTAGIGLGPLVAIAMNWVFNMAGKWWDALWNAIHGMPSWLHTVLTALPQALPWCAGAAIVLIVVFHMLPKFGKGIHGHTPWLAFLAPAAIGVFPPLFSMISGG